MLSACGWLGGVFCVLFFVFVLQKKNPKEKKNSVNSYIKFTRDDTIDGKLLFVDCAVLVENDESFVTKVYRKPTHTN